MSKLWSSLRTLMELIRFSHTVFALPFALLAAAMATYLDYREGRSPRWLDWLGIFLCMVFARSAAMAFNRLADRHLDALNPRTASRHLPRGVLRPAEVAVFTGVCAVGFVLSCTLFIFSSGNWLPLYLAGPVLLFILAYSYTKRFTAFSHAWLGASLMLAPIGAWIALRGTIEWPPIWLGLAVLTWVTGFDIIYACLDVEFDRRQGLHSLPAWLGPPQALRVSAMLHGATVLCLTAVGLSFPLGPVYWIGVLGAAGLLTYEHFLARPDDPRRIHTAFFQVNAVFSLGLFLLGLLDLTVRLFP